MFDAMNSSGFKSPGRTSAFAVIAQERVSNKQTLARSRARMQMKYTGERALNASTEVVDCEFVMAQSVGGVTHGWRRRYSEECYRTTVFKVAGLTL
jgi:hypothetical protein